jgi:hypothetical protein
MPTALLRRTTRSAASAEAGGVRRVGTDVRDE